MFPVFLEGDNLVMPQAHKRLKYEIQITVPGKDNIKKFFEVEDPLFSLTCQADPCKNLNGVKKTKCMICENEFKLEKVIYRSCDFCGLICCEKCLYQT